MKIESMARVPRGAARVRRDDRDAAVYGASDLGGNVAAGCAVAGAGGHDHFETQLPKPLSRKFYFLSDAARWIAHEFPYKPGDPMCRPAVCSSQQPRLDWRISFAAMSTPSRHPWTLHVVRKLLHNGWALLGAPTSRAALTPSPTSTRARARST